MHESRINNHDRAETLIHALPYIQKYMGKTMVVKYGGNAMINGELKAAVIQDVVLMACVGIRTVLVHGGGPEIEAMLKKTGKESRFVQGLRYTDAETMEIVQMVLAGKVNKDIVSLIQQAGGKALGLCGIDGGLLQGRRYSSGGEDLGLVGEITRINTEVLDTALDRGYVPVVSTVALGTGDDAGQALNVNADTAAAQIAAAMHAEKLVLMTDVRGILRNVDDPDSLIKEISRAELDGLKREGIVSKGMIPKVDCCRTALDGGVNRAHIIDGRVPHTLLIELFTDEGIGTMIKD
ncbi:acetylglutamate kinase [Breznakiella homolactica]|uniref:Acetylglutamate kinase n=1 Tax=Breznakiella homolactica TaxID=2798577 RepID=A0A7T7XMR2_9SPIR|nr:acetylglutamate kinase [Breznakiella homolactica]QQO09219.1 acetylglutamate kinase [Breznakiella homolactica]